MKMDKIHAETSRLANWQSINSPSEASFPASRSRRDGAFCFTEVDFPVDRYRPEDPIGLAAVMQTLHERVNSFKNLTLDL